MGVKTVCEDLFIKNYKRALNEKNPSQALEKNVKDLEQIVHSMRLFQYLTLVGERLGVRPVEPEKDFAETFKALLREVLNAFWNQYGDKMEDLNRETFVDAFLRGERFDMGQVEGTVEDLIILLLGFLVDKTLSEVYALTKIKNLVRERQGKNLPLL